MPQMAIPHVGANAGGVPLSTRAVCAWSFAGGIFVVLSEAKLFQVEKILEFLDTTWPTLSLIGFAISCAIVATTSIVWTLAHRPIHSEKIALQLGMVAPAALSALLAASLPDNRTDLASTVLGQLGKELTISSAHAQPVDDTLEPTAPGPLECILGGIIRRPC